MKKNNITLIVCLIVGLITGVIVGHLLQSVPSLSFLTQSAQISWEPKADLDVLKYDFHLQVKLNLCSIIGLVSAFFIYRRL
jgi:uncharacterized membrane protein